MKDLITQARAVEARLREYVEHYHVLQGADTISSLITALEAAQKDVAELRFLESDLLYWVDRAASKGNANFDVEEAHERWEKWQQERYAAIAAQEVEPCTP